MVDPRQKGARAESVIRDVLKEKTGLGWERTPGSGALDPKHMLKGDLYVPSKDNLYCIECKHYEDDHINSGILTHKSPQIIEWWEQAVRQAKQVGKNPLLIFKHNRSKIFVAFESIPSGNYRFLYVSALDHEFYVAILEDWLATEKPKFVK